MANVTTRNTADRGTLVWLIGGILKGAVILALLHQSCSLDHGLEPSVQGISGMVRFHGAWPDSILEVRVAVFADYPVESFVDLSGYSDSVPLGSDSAAYSIQLAPGRYDFIAAAGRTTTTWNTGCILGFYHTETDPEDPRSVDLESGEYLDGIDITVSFEAATVGAGAEPGRFGAPLGGREVKPGT